MPDVSKLITKKLAQAGYTLVKDMRALHRDGEMHYVIGTDGNGYTLFQAPVMGKDVSLSPMVWNAKLDDAMDYAYDFVVWWNAYGSAEPDGALSAVLLELDDFVHNRLWFGCRIAVRPRLSAALFPPARILPVGIHVGAVLRQDELLEFALVFQDEERHLHLGYDPAVFDVDAHELPDTVEAVVQRVLVDEQLLACFGGMGGVLQVDEQRVGEIRSMLQILFDHMHERRVA